MKLLLIALLVSLLAGCISQVPECSKSSDCLQLLCPGTTAKCISGKCVYEYSNGTIANCTNTSIDTRAANYCMNQGYGYKIETSSDGRQTGYCYVPLVLPSGDVPGYTHKCEEWSFYRGECPTCRDYCELKPHIECVGYWNISGSFPDCQCNYACSSPANNMNKNLCETYGGHWNECGSACTGEPPGTV
jgi:putative hemolysin